MESEGDGGATGRRVPPAITHEEVRQRQSAARELANRAGYDALLVVGRSFYDRPGDLAYLSNHFPPFPTAVFSEVNRGMGHAFLLLPMVGDATLLTDPRRHREDLVAVEDVRAAADLGVGVVDLLRERGLERGRVGLVGDDIMPAAFDRFIARALPALTLEPEPGVVAGLRQIKSAAEQALLREAARCADAGLAAALTTLERPGVTEREVCAAGIAAAMRAGADFVRYFRVHSGVWSAAGSRWPQAMDRVIEPGEVVAMDIIGAYQGYGFDVLRTTVVGTPDAERRAMLDAVEGAVEQAVGRCTAGATVGEVVQAAEAIFATTAFASQVGSLMGHGIGLETVEEPYVQQGGSAELRPGMVLCIEPGIFVPGWAGASIEQEVIIRDEGPPEVITPTATHLW